MKYNGRQMERKVRRQPDGPFSVRLERNTYNRLVALARKHKLPSSALARRALQDRLPVWEQEGVRL